LETYAYCGTPKRTLYLQTGTGFVHDGNGNPTTDSGTTLTFDPENRLTSYGSVLTAGYSGNGLRAWKQNAVGRAYFLYDGIVPVVELDSGGSVTATNTLGTAGLVSRTAGSASVFYSYVTNNPSNWIDPFGWAKLLYWPAHGASKAGHIALLLEDGTYILTGRCARFPKIHRLGDVVHRVPQITKRISKRKPVWILSPFKLTA